MRSRRFHVQFPSNAAAGTIIPIPPDESRHIQVLRLDENSEVELFDNSGLTAKAKLKKSQSGWEANLLNDPTKDPNKISSNKNNQIKIAVAWPKAKRASWMVEKCTELGVISIQPVRFQRSVVTKKDGSSSIERLQRIAVSAAKQCGRNDIPEIKPELGFNDFLKKSNSSSNKYVLFSVADQSLNTYLTQNTFSEVLMTIGPEGGFTEEELKKLRGNSFQEAHLGNNILRIETAATAACAVAASSIFFP